MERISALLLKLLTHTFHITIIGLAIAFVDYIFELGNPVLAVIGIVGFFGGFVSAFLVTLHFISLVIGWLLRNSE